MEIPDLDPRSYQSLLKLGGKKKLDALMDLFKASGPERVQELLGASTLAEAHAAAKALKHSAANLGLAALEDTCDQILAAHAWTPKHPLALEAQSRLAKGQAALRQARSTI
jgi:hypothetical protein